VLDKINGLFHGKRDKRASPVPPLPTKAKPRYADSSAGSSVSPSPPANASPAAGTYASPLNQHPVHRKALLDNAARPIQTRADETDNALSTSTLRDLSLKMKAKAERETDPARKKRFMTFAALLYNVHFHARETARHAEIARKAAKDAQDDHDRVQQAAAAVHKLATILSSPSRRH
jgi:hypothetical protein